MRSKISLSVLLALSLVGIAAARADDDDPAKGHFTLEEATKGLKDDEARRGGAKSS